MYSDKTSSGQLNSMLLKGESLLATAFQVRILALTHRREGIGVTDQRLLAITPHLVAGFKSFDVRWQDLKDVYYNADLISAKLTILIYGKEDFASASGSAQSIVFKDYDKKDLQEVYRICQSQAQQWREKRRIRELEEIRARSGGMVIGGGIPQPGADGDMVTRLQQIADLRKAGHLNDAEFEAAKAKILSGHS